MALTAGREARVRKIGTSTSITSSSESMSNVSGDTYRIDNTAKNIWDASTTISFERDDGSGGRETIPSNEIESINYLFGEVTFSVSQATPITVVGGNYFPHSVITEAYNVNLELTANTEDTSNFTHDWVRTNVTLKNGNVTLSKWEEDQNSFLDFFNDLKNGDTTIIDFRPDDSATEGFRMLARVTADNRSASPDSYQTEEISLSITEDSDNNINIGWGVLA